MENFCQKKNFPVFNEITYQDFKNHVIFCASGEKKGQNLIIDPTSIPVLAHIETKLLKSYFSKHFIVSICFILTFHELNFLMTKVTWGGIWLSLLFSGNILMSRLVTALSMVLTVVCFQKMELIIYFWCLPLCSSDVFVSI